MMHRDYLQKFPEPKISYELYRKQVAEMNISFAALGHEECWQCESFDVHSKTEGHSKQKISPECEECVKWKKHHDNAVVARTEYKNDASKELLAFSVDLQKVVMLPRCEMFKEQIFTPRIICFNESFVPIGKKSNTRKPVAVIWHEGIAGRNKFDIMSSFYKFCLLYRDAPELILWIDNCAAQNKNWNLYCFFVYLINSPEINCSLITLKYLETGHTFMSADSFHHQVEKSLKQKKKVMDFEDYVNCIKKSNNSRVEVINMNVTDFYDAKDHSSRFKLGKTKPKPYLNDFNVVQFRRDHKNLFYKTEFNGPFIELNFLTNQAFKSGVPPPTIRNEPKGVDINRKLNLISKLSEILPPNRLKFWNELPVLTNSD